MNLAEVVKFQNPFAELFLLSLGYYFLRTAVFAGLAAYLIAKTGLFESKPIYRIPTEKSQFLRELEAGALILLFDAAMAATLIYFNLFHHSGPGLVLYLYTFTLIFVWFEVWFYFVHRLLHSRRLFFVHAQHHTAKVTTPMTALSFSVTERAFLLIGGMGVPSLLSHWIPLSFKAYAAYFVLNYALNVYGHLNVEVLAPHALKRRGGQFLNSTTYHALHHARFNGHFGLFTPYLDRWFGTRYEDFLQVHELAYSGNGLQKLQQRVAL